MAWVNRSLDLGTNGIDRFAKIAGKLHAQPITRRLAKISTEMKVGFRSDTALFVDDLIDTLLGKLRIFRQPVGRDAHRLKELFTEEFAGMDVDVLFHGLVIIGDFYVVGVLTVPPEAYAILVVYTNAVLAGSVAFERFEPVARRETQFVEG